MDCRKNVGASNTCVTITNANIRGLNLRSVGCFDVSVIGASRA